LVYVPFFGYIRKDITTNYKPLTISFNTTTKNYPNIQNKPNNIYNVIQNLSFNTHSNIKN